MTSKVKLETKGMFDLVVRSVAAMMSEDQQKEIDRADPPPLAAGCRSSSRSTMTSALALFTPMEVNIEIKVPNAAPKTGDYRLLRTLVTSGALGLVENALPQVLGAMPTRKYGLDAQVTFRVRPDRDDHAAGRHEDRRAAERGEDRRTRSRQMTSSCTKKDATTIKCHRSFQLKSRFIDRRSTRRCAARSRRSRRSRASR